MTAGADTEGMAMAETVYRSPLGPLRLREAHGHIVRLEWGPAVQEEPARGHDDTPLLSRARHQLDAYFLRGLRRFDLPVAPAGTAFQLAVWQQMQAIPYGDTRTYGEIARWLHSAPRAVGTACGRNPIPIVIPCHRVVASAGFGGYSGAGGVDTKRWLLAHEGWPDRDSGTLFEAPAPAAGLQ